MRIKLFEEFSNEELDSLGYEIRSRCIWLEDEGFDIEVAKVKESLHPVLRIKISKGEPFDVLDIDVYVKTIADYLRRNYEDVKINYVIDNKVYDPVMYGIFIISKDTTCKSLFYMRCKLGKLKNT